MSTLRLTNLQHTDASDPNIVLANDRTAALADGTASAPALSFQDDLDTGLYSPGANSIALGVGGSAILTIASTGNTTFTGAITTTSLSAQSTATNSWFQTGTNLGGVNYVWATKDTSANVWHSGLQTDGDLYLGGNLVGTTNIKLNGSDGSATFAGDAQFGTGAADARITIGSHGTAGTNNSVHVRADSANLLFMSGSGGVTKFEQNGTQRLLIDSDGNVIVGASQATNAEFTIRAAAPQLSLYATPGNVSRITFGDTDDWNIGQVYYDNDTNKLYLYTNNDDRMVIDNSGNVGIGTTSPEEILHVAAASETANSRDGVMFQSTSALAADTGLPLVFTSHIGSQANYGVASIAGRKENATSGQAGGYLQFATGNSAGAISEKVRILSSGGITFNGDTATANALDDYEEGTWTPTGNNNFNGITNAEGYYTKVGKIVTLNFQFNYTSLDDSTTYSAVAGVPFQPGDYNSNTGVEATNCIFGTNKLVLIYVNSNSSSLFFETSRPVAGSASTGADFFRGSITYLT